MSEESQKIDKSRVCTFATCIFCSLAISPIFVFSRYMVWPMAAHELLSPGGENVSENELCDRDESRETLMTDRAQPSPMLEMMKSCAVDNDVRRPRLRIERGKCVATTTTMHTRQKRMGKRGQCGSHYAIFHHRSWNMAMSIPVICQRRRAAQIGLWGVSRLTWSGLESM